MPRHAKPADLTMHSRNGPENGKIQAGPNSSPMNLQGVDLGSFGGGFEYDVASGLTPLPALPQSPPGSPRTIHNKDPSKTFLSSFKNRVSPEQEQNQKKDSRQGSSEGEQYRPGTSSMSKIYHLRNNPGSSPELSLVGSNENVDKDVAEGGNPTLPGSHPQVPPHRSEDNFAKRKDQKFPRMIRSKSIRRDSNPKLRPNGTSNGKNSLEHHAPPNTAPLQSDWPGSNARMLGKEKDRRGKSAERAPASGSEENLSSSYKGGKGGFSSNVKKGFSAGGNLLNRLGKIGRSSSSNEKEVPDSEYVFKVINQPLVEQTRITRISKQLSGCRDKTEYWMPSLPWRCIDYLNTNCEEEGLYRIPGSGPQVKHWQRRFDSELDIDLLSEEVRDTNEIASMLKAWLRELPTEIMPASLQRSLAIELEKENPQYKNVGQPASQILRDALSDLPPFNYYLLFAITCHLSLLLTNKDRNKMDLNNLAVCVGPCLYLERWLFNYLVGDWRHCWQGCYTEKEYLKIEEMVEAGVDPAESLPSEYSDERSLASTMWATTLDGASISEAVSLDERGLSSGSASVTSKQIGMNDDPRFMSRDTLHGRNAENIKPSSYLSSSSKVSSNGPVGLGINEEMKRPATADQRNAPQEGMTGMKMNTNMANHTKSHSNSSTPRVGHSRSRSDLPATPIKADGDFNFPVRPPA